MEISVFQSSFNRDDIRQQSSEAYPEILTCVESLPFSPAGKRLLSEHPQIESLFDLVMTSYPEDPDAPKYLLDNVSIKKVAGEHQAAIHFIGKLVREQHRIYRNSTLYQLQQHFVISDKPVEFFRKHHPELAGVRDYLIEDTVDALPAGTLRTVDELMAITRFSLFDLILDKGLVYEKFRIPNIDFLTAIQDYCLQTLPDFIQAAPAPLQHNPKSNEIAEYHDYRKRLEDVESDKLHRHLRKWSSHVRSVVNKKNTVFVHKELADALYIAHTWHQWEVNRWQPAKTDSHYSYNPLDHDGFFRFALKNIDSLSANLDLISEYNTTMERLYSSPFNKITWIIDGNTTSRLGVDNERNSLCIQLENGEWANLHSSIGSIISYLIRSAIILQRQDVIEACLPALDKLTLFAKALPGYLEHYALWPKVIAAIKESGPIPTLRLYRELGANGLTLKPLLNTAEYMNIIKNEKNVISLIKT